MKGAIKHIQVTCSTSKHVNIFFNKMVSTGPADFSDCSLFISLDLVSRSDMLEYDGHIKTENGEP